MKRILLIILSFFFFACDDSELNFIDSFPFEIKAQLTDKKEEFEEDKGKIFLDEIHPFEIDVIIDREIPNTEYQITYLSNQEIEIRQNYEKKDTLFQMKGKRNYEFIPKKVGNYKITFDAFDKREHYATNELEFVVEERVKIVYFVAEEHRKKSWWGERKSDFEMHWHITGLEEDDKIFLYFWTNNLEEIEKEVNYYKDIQSNTIETKVHRMHYYQGKVSIEIRRGNQILIKKRKIIDSWDYYG